MDDASAYICRACGTEFAPSSATPARCPICEDDRQYVPSQGQVWTTLEALRGHYHNRFIEREPGVTAIVTEPSLAIGQQAHLIETPDGNLLWDCLTFLDETTLAEIGRRGGVAAIAISHPHYYATMARWSDALAAPVYLHAADREWIVQPPARLALFDAERVELLPGATVLRCGGHFPGATVLHLAPNATASGSGLLFSGDTIQVVPRHGTVSFMYSYPNQIPLDAQAVQRIIDAVAPYPFERLYGAFGRQVPEDADAAVRRSADRYIRHLSGRGQRWAD